MSGHCRALHIDCQGECLIGVLHSANPAATRAVLVVVGGPQYRVGSHRQFVHLARALATAGIPVLRFDYRGMGDSDGQQRDFEHIDHDIACAIDALCAALPALNDVVIWGLCDAASAAMMYAHTDPRVAGIVAVNPWVRTEQGLAQTYLRHYYGRRLLQGDFWRKALTGRLNLWASLRALLTNLGQARGADGATDTAPLGFVQRMYQGLAAFDGRLLLVLSGDDLTAQEFSALMQSDPAWQQRLQQPGVTQQRLPNANHTFSRAEWRDQVNAWTVRWVRSW